MNTPKKPKFISASTWNKLDDLERDILAHSTMNEFKLCVMYALFADLIGDVLGEHQRSFLPELWNTYILSDTYCNLIASERRSRVSMYTDMVYTLERIEGMAHN